MKKTILNSIVVLSIFLFSGCSIKDYKLFQTETKKQEQTTLISAEEYKNELAYENKILYMYNLDKVLNKCRQS